MRKITITCKSLLGLQKISKVVGLSVLFLAAGSSIAMASGATPEVVESNEIQAKKQVKGRVIDSKGEALISVSVAEKGTSNGSMTDFDGNFTLNVEEGATLVFTYIGYTTKEVKVGAQSEYVVTLSDDTQALDEVVVIAYGTAKKKDLTGSISSVDTKAIELQANSSVSKSLEGAAPGVQLMGVDGQPGVDSGIIIRGLGSMNPGNSEALVVIDGVPANSGTNVLATLNPKDIESMTVLKDAASTAIYGSRGANGVIMITTKKGKQGRAKITYEGRFGWNEVGPGRVDLVNDPAAYYEYAWSSIYNAVRYYNPSNPTTTNVLKPNMSHDEAALFASQHLFNYNGNMTSFERNGLGNYLLYDVPGMTYQTTGKLNTSTQSATLVGAYLVGVDGKLNPNAKRLYYDPLEDQFLEKNFRQEHNLSVSGASEKNDYYLSLGYLEDPSYITGSSFDRYNVRGSFNSQVLPWLRSGINMGYSQRKTLSQSSRYGRNPGNVSQNVFSWLDISNPLAPTWARDANNNVLTDASGNKVFNNGNGNSYSPLGLTGAVRSAGYDLDYILKNDKDVNDARDLSLRTYATATFLNDFSLTLNASLDNYDNMRTRFRNGVTGQDAGSLGSLQKQQSSSSVFNLQQLLNWGRDFGNHHVDGLLGHEYNRYKSEGLNYKGFYSVIEGFLGYSNYIGLNGGAPGSNIGGSLDRVTLESYFFRGNYNYAGKYYASISARRDGSSKFKKSSNRWGNFWSVGGSWRITEEDFMASSKSWLDELKVRASYGIAGNQNGVANYSGYQTWSYGSSVYTNSGQTINPKADNLYLNPGNAVNEDLTWEKIYGLDLGLDFKLFNRVYGSLDYFSKETRQLIWERPLPISLGQNSILENDAKLRNQGIEIDLGVDIIRTSDLKWSVNINAAHYWNRLLEVPDYVKSKALDGNYLAGAEGWNSLGVGGASQACFLRGEGKDLFNFYLYKYGGVDQNTGLALYYHKVTQNDVNAGTYGASVKAGDDVKTTNFNAADRYEVGTATPDVIGGFSTTLYYKSFDFTAQFAYQLGGKFFSTDFANGWYNSGTSISSPRIKDFIGDTWTPENTGAKFPMQIYKGNAYATSGSTVGSWAYTDLALFSASYLSFKNITLGYTLPKAITNKAFMENVRIYASVDNIWLLTAQKGIDPRISLNGGWNTPQSPYPPMRSFNAGINVTF